ncbi:hypothetical protein P12x_000740 [Tundrisphaera lichenicola]|uniref:hypothetical protein n=1 Tax=Tundrisphaera lichenicola TaxID=2029860 RepID=UPI003EBBCF18
MLGGAFLGQKKYAEAETLLLAGYEGMQSVKPRFQSKANTPSPKPSTVSFNRQTRRNRKCRKELDTRRAADPQFMTLNERLANVLKGDEPKDNAEGLTIAQHAFNEKLYSTSVQLWTEALKADPKLPSDRSAEHRYNVARSALRAATGTGKDNTTAPDEASKAKLRMQALDGLKAELSARKRVAMIIEPGSKERVSTTLVHWKQDDGLANIRDTWELVKLPSGKQKEL